MALVLEPIPQFSALFLSLRMAKANEGPLGSSIQELDGRSKSTRSSDRAGWLAIYKDTLQLLPRIIEHHGSPPTSSPEPRNGEFRVTPLPKARLTAAPSNAQSAFQRAITDWTPRLATQERDLLKRAEAAFERLGVVSKTDESVGELVYSYEPAALDAFWRWLADAERTWADNNSALVATRAQEALADTLAELPPEMAAFRVRNAPIDMGPAAHVARLHGHRIPNPGFFQSVGTTYRFVMSAVTAASGLGFFATRVVGGKVAESLPIVLGLVFVATVIVAVVTLPKQRRQAMARIKAQASKVLERELADAVRARLKLGVDTQMTAIRRHLGQETARLKAFWRETEPADVPSGAVIKDTARAIVFSMGQSLMPADVARLRGEWKDAIELRAREIEASLAGEAAPG